MNTQNTDHASLTREYDRMQQCLLSAYNQVLECEASELQSNIQSYNTDLDSFQFAITIMDKWKDLLEKKRKSITDSMTVHLQKKETLKEMRKQAENLQNICHVTSKRPRTDQAIVSILPEYL